MRCRKRQTVMVETGGEMVPELIVTRGRWDEKHRSGKKRGESMAVEKGRASLVGVARDALVLIM